MLTKAPKGTKDITPTDSYKWQYIEDAVREVCKTFNFKEIRTPTFEHTELFERGVGDTSDVVEKQMYTFMDKGNRSITLRPEVTASVVRAFLENSLYAGVLPSKLFYISPCYRYEKPQAGRLREFHQFGVEAFGSKEASMDAEIISLAVTFFNRLGLENLELNINSIGCKECRTEYNEKLKEYFKQHTDTLCETCNSRLERNPLRILDCKSPVCGEIGKNAPVLLEYICGDCSEHFEKLKKNLTNIGLDYKIDTGIVRGLDYYNKTVFEITSEDIGSKSTVCGGGRYDALVEELGGNSTPAIGFGLGIERLILALENQGILLEEPKNIDLYIGSIGQNATEYAQKLAYELRQSGVCVEVDHLARSVKAQMKYADKINVKHTIIIGDNEIDTNKANLKNMSTGETKEIELDKLKIEIKEAK